MLQRTQCYGLDSEGSTPNRPVTLLPDDSCRNSQVTFPNPSFISRHKSGETKRTVQNGVYQPPLPTNLLHPKYEDLEDRYFNACHIYSFQVVSKSRGLAYLTRNSEASRLRPLISVDESRQSSDIWLLVNLFLFFWCAGLVILSQLQIPMMQESLPNTLFKHSS